MSFKVKCFSIIFGVIILVSIILFGSSFAVLELNNVALLKNSVSVTVEEGTIYKPGRHFVGLVGSFISYPTTWQYIRFSKDRNTDSHLIQGKTKTASSIELEITLTYRLKYEFTHDLYKKFPSANHHQIMVNSAKNSIQLIINKYDNNDFFQRRNEIANRMSYEISKEFKEYYYSEVTLFLLREVLLEPKFEKTLIDQQVNKREAITTKMKQEIDVLSGEINIIASEAQIEVDKLTAEAQRISTEIKATNLAEGKALIMKSQVDSYKDFLDQSLLGFKEAELMKFMYSDKMRNIDNTKILGGFPQNSIIKA